MAFADTKINQSNRANLSNNNICSSSVRNNPIRTNSTDKNKKSMMDADKSWSKINSTYNKLIGYVYNFATNVPQQPAQ